MIEITLILLALVLISHGALYRLQRMQARRLHYLLERPTVRGEVEQLRQTIGALRKQLGQQGARLSRMHRFVEAREADLERRLDDGLRQIGCRVALQDLDLNFPVFLGDWAIDAVLARELVFRIETMRPQTIVELGSGSSSVIVAATLRKLSLNARHVVVDHLAEFLETTRRNLEVHGLDTGIEFLHCPLEATQEGIPWYSIPPDLFGLASIDLVLVDGPPSAGHKRAREPALPRLAHAIRIGGVLLLDDTTREEEAAIVERWKTSFPNFRAKVSPRGKGYATFERES